MVLKFLELTENVLGHCYLEFFNFYSYIGFLTPDNDDSIYYLIIRKRLF